jgi:K+ transporter
MIWSWRMMMLMMIMLAARLAALAALAALLAHRAAPGATHKAVIRRKLKWLAILYASIKNRSMLYMPGLNFIKFEKKIETNIFKLALALKEPRIALRA